MANKDQAEDSKQSGLEDATDVRGERRKRADDAPHTGEDTAAEPPEVPASVGMGWVQSVVAGRVGLVAEPELDPDARPQDTRAYGRGSARPDPGRTVVPRTQGGRGSNLNPLLSIPVMSVADLPASKPSSTPRPVTPDEVLPLPRVTVLSSPAKHQRCPQCKGPLRVIRSTHERRLECTWFRLEWLEIERGWADCKLHPQVPTCALQDPAFVLPSGHLGNGLLARVATWRWQDHMLGPHIKTLLGNLEIRCTNTDVARYLQAAASHIAPVAQAIRAATTGGKADALGLFVVDGGEDGRLRATTKGKLVSFDWTPTDDELRPDDVTERARSVMLDLRGWSQAGAQANLRRIVARGLGTSRDQAARISWRLEELRCATDHATELAALQAVLPMLQDPALLDPHLKSAARELSFDDGARLCRFTAADKPAPPPPKPENAQAVLPRWFLTAGDGNAQQVTDWLTLSESCTSTGQSMWSLLRDLFDEIAAAEPGPDGQPLPVDGERWIPGRRR